MMKLGVLQTYFYIKRKTYIARATKNAADIELIHQFVGHGV